MTNYTQSAKDMTNYTRAARFLGSKLRRTVPSIRSTVVYRVSADVIALRYHGTDVVTWFEDGSFRLNSGGYRTVTTKARMNAFSTARVWQDKHVWYTSHVIPSATHRTVFEDGMQFSAAGYPVLQEEVSL